jgi:hypothetical protein
MSIRWIAGGSRLRPMTRPKESVARARFELKIVPNAFGEKLSCRKPSRLACAATIQRGGAGSADRASLGQPDCGSSTS